MYRAVTSSLPDRRSKCLRFLAIGKNRKMYRDVGLPLRQSRIGGLSAVAFPRLIAWQELQQCMMSVAKLRVVSGAEPQSLSQGNIHRLVCKS